MYVWVGGLSPPTRIKIVSCQRRKEDPGALREVTHLSPRVKVRAGPAGVRQTEGGGLGEAAVRSSDLEVKVGSPRGDTTRAGSTKFHPDLELRRATAVDLTVCGSRP